MSTTHDDVVHNHGELHHEKARERLPLLKSPVIDSPSRTNSLSPGLDPGHMGDRVGPFNDSPKFQRHEDASILELFFDLLFAANYTVFSQAQGVINTARLQAYVGYFTLLWMTWMLVGLYDVRFVTDSVFERIARAAHVGVMVGFAVVAPKFDPTDQNRQTMQTMSVILVVSRFALAIEYGSILYHVRRFRHSRLPLYLQIGLNIVAALIYLGITFRFEKHNSRVYVTWYVVSGAELIINLLISNFWEVLSFTETHLMRRLSLLTIVILGDGIIVMCQDVVTIVKNADAWDPATVGIVTAASATIYFVFLTYFDWMRNDYLPPWRQQVWTCIHFPFHLSAVLFMQGFTQFIIWTKIFNVIEGLTSGSILASSLDLSNATSAEVKQEFTTYATNFYSLYPPQLYGIYQTTTAGIDNITKLPDSFWPELNKFIATQDPADSPPTSQLDELVYILDAILSSMVNNLFETFGVSVESDDQLQLSQSNNISNGSLETNVSNDTLNRYALVFTYGYIAAGVTLIFMTLLTIVSRVSPWKPWTIIRTVIYLLLGAVMSIVPVLDADIKAATRFLVGPWVVPTICLIWTAVVILTHIRHPPPLFFKRGASFFSRQTSFNTNTGLMAKSDLGIQEPSPHNDEYQLQLTSHQALLSRQQTMTTRVDSFPSDEDAESNAWPQQAYNWNQPGHQVKRKLLPPQQTA